MTKTPTKFPGLSKELIDALDRQFPERSAEPEWTDREVWINAGKRQAIRFIINKFNEQLKAAVDNKVKI